MIVAMDGSIFGAANTLFMANFVEKIGSAS